MDDCIRTQLGQTLVTSGHMSVTCLIVIHYTNVNSLGA